MYDMSDPSIEFVSQDSTLRFPQMAGKAFSINMRSKGEGRSNRINMCFYKVDRKFYFILFHCLQEKMDSPTDGRILNIEEGNECSDSL